MTEKQQALLQGAVLEDSSLSETDLTFADKKADFTAADIKRSETQCVYGIFVGDKAVLNAASENINISVTNTEGEARAVYAGAFTDKD